MDLDAPDEQLQYICEVDPAASLFLILSAGTRYPHRFTLLDIWTISPSTGHVSVPSGLQAYAFVTA